MCQSFSSSISQSVYTQHLDWFQIIPRNDCYLLIDYHENLDDDDDFDNDYENFENDYEDFVCDVLDDHNDIDDHDDIDDHYDVDGHDNADDHYGENISLALNVLPCFKERLQFLNIRVKSTTTFTMYTPRGSFKLVFYRKTTISVPHCLSV